MLGFAETKVSIANGSELSLESTQPLSGKSFMATTDKKSSIAQMEKIESRFGPVTIDKAKAILFPVGILGMPDKHNFVLTEFPNPKLNQFKMLQSLDDQGLAFITLPIDVDNGIVERTDIETACHDMEIPMADLGLVLIVSVHRGTTGAQLSVNARAPIFIDTARKAAAQYVFTSNKYKVQHFITGEAGQSPA